MGSHESILVRMPHCWKSHVTTELVFQVVKLNVMSWLICLLMLFAKIKFS